MAQASRLCCHNSHNRAARGREIIAFGMGPAGKWSRVVAPLMGSFLTFAPFTKKGASAPGQLTVNEVKRLWQMLKR